jgi:hypothetical protein
MALQAIQGEVSLSLDNLTPEEQRHFLRDVADGSLSKFVEPWEPWWERSEEQFMAQLKLQQIETSQQHSGLQENDESDKHNADEIDPDISSHMNISGCVGPPAAALILLQPSAWPPVSQLCRNNPPAELQFNLVDVLLSYCCTMRIFQGDWSADVGEASAMMIQLSAVLQRDARHCRCSLCGWNTLLIDSYVFRLSPVSMDAALQVSRNYNSCMVLSYQSMMDLSFHHRHLSKGFSLSSLLLPRCMPHLCRRDLPV